MPFRVPNEYEKLSVMSLDPGATTLWNYVLWLRQELAVAEAALAEKERPEPKSKTPKEK